MRVFPREIVASRPFLEEVETGLERLADKPALILWADEDPAFKERERARFEALFRRHRTVILRGAGHEIAEDAPEEIAGAIHDWWIEMVEGLRGDRADAPEAAGPARPAEVASRA